MKRILSFIRAIILDIMWHKDPSIEVNPYDKGWDDYFEYANDRASMISHDEAYDFYISKNQYTGYDDIASYRRGWREATESFIRQVESTL